MIKIVKKVDISPYLPYDILIMLKGVFVMVNGKSTGIIGAVISVIFSLIGLFSFMGLKALFQTQDYITEFNKGFVEGGGAIADAAAALDVIIGLLSFGQIIMVILLIIGVIGFVLLLLTNNSNNKKMAPFILVISILHILSLRVLAFVLLLISYRQLSKVELEN